MTKLSDRTFLAGLLVLGALIDLACRFIPADLPWFMPFIFNAPEFLAAGLALWWYARGLARTPPEALPRRRRVWLYYLGIIGMYAVLQTRFDYYAQHMFFLDRTQQVMIGVFGPFMLAVSWPGEILARGVPAVVLRVLSWRPVRLGLLIAAHPLVAALTVLLVTNFWLIPSINFIAMLDPLVYAVMNISMILAGLLFWFVVLDPRPKPACRYSYLARMIAGFMVMFPQILITAVIALSAQLFYNFYDLCGRILPGMSAQYDQMLGGMIQWIPPGVLNTCVLFVLLNAIRLNDEKLEKTRVIPPGTKVIEARWTGR
ncbi:MAG TPA: cytochrome c oxidase assembly protein [Acetobacteraceae bacterium]|nr:cytochrome c oxidase assembly protein [Acetobacteraceae bacterium]